MIEKLESALSALKTGTSDAEGRVTDALSELNITTGDIRGASAVAIGSDIRIAVTRTTLPDSIVNRLLELADLLEARGTGGWVGRRHVRIFVSSPGDVLTERAIARRVISRVQADPVYRDHLTLEVVAWDDPDRSTPMLVSKTPQDAINEGLVRPSECDIVIVLLWSRMGTPLPLDAYQKPEDFHFPNSSGLPLEQYYSGTEWEYVDAVQAARRRQAELGVDRPLVAVYRRTEPPQISLDDPDIDTRLAQFNLLKAFFEGFRDEDGAIRRGVNFYGSAEEFEMLFEQHLRTLLARLAEQPTNPSSPASTEPPPRIEWPENRSPFPGLRAFRPPDAPVFFGRSAEVVDLLQRVEHTPFVAVMGASGAGKSSLVGAGLIPRLADGALEGSAEWLLPDYHPHRWSGIRFTPGTDPLLAFARTCADAFDLSPDLMVRRLKKNPEEMIDTLLQLLKYEAPWAKVLVFVDQFEEIFTLASPEDRRHFIRVLAAAVNFDRVRMVVTMRADFADRCAEDPLLNALLQPESTYWLSRPGRGDLHEMITQPAAVTGLKFEEGLEWRILEETGDEPGALALTAYALEQLFHERTPDGLLTQAAYEGFGGVEGAIGVQAQKAFDAVSEEARAALPRVFRHLVEIDRRTGATMRRRAAPHEIVADPAAAELVRALTDARLLVSGSFYLEVAHEALLRSWPALVRWIDDVEDALVTLRQVSLTAHDWDAHGRDDAFLWPHERLQFVYDAIERLGEPQLDPLVEDFIQPEAERLLDEIDDPETPNDRRAAIGDRLDEIGDPRAGIGVLSVSPPAPPPGTLRLWDRPGLPDLIWLPVAGGPAHIGEQVFEVAPFHIAHYPLTYDQWLTFLEDGFEEERWWSGMKQPRSTARQSRPSGNHPADGINGYEVIAFCRWLNAQIGCDDLPDDLNAETLHGFRGVRPITEWEWVRATRGDDHDRTYPWGDEWDPTMTNTTASGLGRPIAVGMFPHAASPTGALDLTGNIWQWCFSDYDTLGAVSLSSDSWVVRGAAFGTSRKKAASTYRGKNSPSRRNSYIGVRLVFSGAA